MDKNTDVCKGCGTDQKDMYESLCFDCQMRDETDTCIGCGKPLLDGQAVIFGENRHAVCS